MCIWLYAPTVPRYTQLSRCFLRNFRCVICDAVSLISVNRIWYGDTVGLSISSVHNELVCFLMEERTRRLTPRVTYRSETSRASCQGSHHGRLRWKWNELTGGKVNIWYKRKQCTMSRAVGGTSVRRGMMLDVVAGAVNVIAVIVVVMDDERVYRLHDDGQQSNDAGLHAKNTNTNTPVGSP